MAAQIVPKSREKSAVPFDRDRLLKTLFALPCPQFSDFCKMGRPYPADTPLGRIMRLKRMTINDVCRADPDVPNHRVMSDYLANRRPIMPHHRAVLGRVLGVDSRLL